MTLAEAHSKPKKYKLPEDNEYYRIDDTRYIQLCNAIRDDWEVEPDEPIKCTAVMGYTLGTFKTCDLDNEQREYLCGKHCRITIEPME